MPRIFLIYAITLMSFPLLASWEPGAFEEFLEQSCRLDSQESADFEDDLEISDSDNFEELSSPIAEPDYFEHLLEKSCQLDPSKSDYIEQQPLDRSEPDYSAQQSLEPSDCPDRINSPQSMRASLRYTSPRGIGYDSGYTTLEYFAATQRWGSWVPFVDVRGHVFDTGRFAANAGLGIRYIGNSRVWGLNTYYDHRNTPHLRCNQIAGGLESLGKTWDFRINGYLPFGKKDRLFSPQFAFFDGNQMFIRYKRKFSLQGGNAEAGFHLDHFKQAPLYFAGGPYYLHGKGATAWGGQLRATVNLFSHYLWLEANVSYDHLFRWRSQGQISINIPFGSHCNPCKKKKQRPSHAAALCTRALQRIDRHEIIPVNTRRYLNPAINPSTGKPWIFWFVNNTSLTSLGTFKNPFSTLTAAQNASSPNQGIYVFPGDGTSLGMNSGITLQDSQLFLGAAIAHPIPTTHGTVTIPSFAASAPTITNSGDVVTLSNNNTVSGFSIEVQNGGFSGLNGTNIANLFADQNQFTTAPTSAHAILLTNASETITISNSVFIGSINNDGINIVGSSPLDTLNVIGNRFRLFLGSNSIVNNNTIHTVNLSNNTFFASVGGINNSVTGTMGTLNASSNTFSALVLNGIVNNGVMGTLNASANSFNNVLSNGINNNGTLGTLNAVRNTFNTVATGINSSSGTIGDTFHASRNSFGSGDGIVYTTSGSTGNVSLEITDNIFVPPGSPSQGYGANITVNQGTICLKFTGNTAPSTLPEAYAFTQSPPGIFNLTPGSDSSTNTGQFVNTGSFGTCSLP